MDLYWKTFSIFVSWCFFWKFISETFAVINFFSDRATLKVRNIFDLKKKKVKRLIGTDRTPIYLQSGVIIKPASTKTKPGNMQIFLTCILLVASARKSSTELHVLSMYNAHISYFYFQATNCRQSYKALKLIKIRPGTCSPMTRSASCWPTLLHRRAKREKKLFSCVKVKIQDYLLLANRN